MLKRKIEAGYDSLHGRWELPGNRGSENTLVDHDEGVLLAVAHVGATGLKILVRACDVVGEFVVAWYLDRGTNSDPDEREPGPSRLHEAERSIFLQNPAPRIVGYLFAQSRAVLPWVDVPEELWD